MKVKWILDNVLASAKKLKRAKFSSAISTPNLEPPAPRGCAQTDVTNGPHLHDESGNLDWDPDMLKDLHPARDAPAIKPPKCGYRQNPVWTHPRQATWQQAALFGQTCYDPGEAKNTYGTGCFMLMNTGTKPIQSKNGLLTTLGYKIGKEPAVYALEGSIAITGALVQWIRDNLKMIEKSADIEALAKTVDDAGGIYFVPAFRLCPY